jgi:hypothetical protein
MKDPDNMINAHRHVLPSHVLEHDLLHSISHHLRHVVWRTGQEVAPRQRRYVRRHRGPSSPYA